MKSTTSIKKNTLKPKQTKINNYRFWLVLSCAALMGVWYVFVVILFFGTIAMINAISYDPSSHLYNFLSSSSSVFAALLASALSLPFAVAAYKRLKIQKPLTSAIAFFMALTFGFNLYVFVLSGLLHVNYPVTYLVLAVSMVFGGLLYGLAIRPLKHRLSTAKFIPLAVGLAVAPLFVFVF